MPNARNFMSPATKKCAGAKRATAEAETNAEKPKASVTAAILALTSVKVAPPAAPQNVLAQAVQPRRVASAPTTTGRNLERIALVQALHA